MANNKVKYGLKNVYYAIATIDELTNTATYGTPKPWKGAVNLSLDQQGNTTKFRADNIDYWVGTSNNGYSGDLETALIPEAFRVDVLGDIEDSNGVLVEDAGAKTVHFALMFQFEGDAKNVRHVLYNCTATRPSVAGQTTGEDIEPQTETVTLTAVSIYNSGLDKDLVKARVSEDEAQYSSWFTAVYQPTTAATYYTVTFDVDGGSAVTSQSVRSGAKATEPAAPTKAGYEFDGWYTSNTYTTEFNFDSAISADTTVYAKFVELFTVTFDTDGGSVVPSQTVADGSKATRPADPTKEGYTFVNWYKEAAFTNLFDFDDAITADTTIYAKFSV